jgi:hypothetical protein
MNFTDEALQILARQLDEENVSSREELEERVAPLLCLMLQTGCGQPSLLRWVKRHLSLVAPARRAGAPIDPQWAAPRLARLLCSQMLQNVRLHRATVVHRETLVA